MLPVLTVVADAVGIFGGMIIAVAILQVSASQYLSAAWSGLTYMDVFGGLLKPVIFGFLLSLVGCYCGLRTHGGTQGVGRSTTQAVVVASIAILISDLFLTQLILQYTK